jgi:hypothetical protein
MLIAADQSMSLCSQTAAPPNWWSSVPGLTAEASSWEGNSGPARHLLRRGDSRVCVSRWTKPKRQLLVSEVELIPFNGCVKLPARFPETPSQIGVQINQWNSNTGNVNNAVSSEGNVEQTVK